MVSGSFLIPAGINSITVICINVTLFYLSFLMCSFYTSQQVLKHFAVLHQNSSGLFSAPKFYINIPEVCFTATVFYFILPQVCFTVPVFYNSFLQVWFTAPVFSFSFPQICFTAQAIYLNDPVLIYSCPGIFKKIIRKTIFSSKVYHYVYALNKRTVNIPLSCCYIFC